MILLPVAGQNTLIKPGKTGWKAQGFIQSSSKSTRNECDKDVTACYQKTIIC